MTGRLHPDDIETIARRVVALMREEPLPTAPRLVDAAEVARVLGISRDTVYEHANRLGARRLAGPRSRLRFDLAEAVNAWTARDDSKGSQPPAAAPPRRSRRRATASTPGGVPLLPVRSVRSAS